MENYKCNHIPGCSGTALFGVDEATQGSPIWIGICSWWQFASEANETCDSVCMLAASHEN